MKLFTSLFFIASLAVASLAAVMNVDSVDTVKQDGRAAVSLVNDLNNSVVKFVPSPTGVNFQVVHNTSNKVKAGLDKLTVDTNALTATVSEADARELVNILVNAGPPFGNCIQQLIKNRDRFTAIHADGTVKSDLVELRAKSLTAIDALIVKAPDSVKGTARGFRTVLDGLFNKAIAAYN